MLLLIFYLELQSMKITLVLTFIKYYLKLCFTLVESIIVICDSMLEARPNLVFKYYVLFVTEGNYPHGLLLHSLTKIPWIYTLYIDAYNDNAKVKHTIIFVSLFFFIKLQLWHVGHVKISLSIWMCCHLLPAHCFGNDQWFRMHENSEVEAIS